MTDSKTFDREGFAKRITEAGLDRRTAEALADEYAYLAALLRGEKMDPPPARAD